MVNIQRCLRPGHRRERLFTCVSRKVIGCHKVYGPKFRTFCRMQGRHHDAFAGSNVRSPLFSDWTRTWLARGPAFRISTTLSRDFLVTAITPSHSSGYARSCRSSIGTNVVNCASISVARCTSTLEGRARSSY